MLLLYNLTLTVCTNVNERNAFKMVNDVAELMLFNCKFILTN